jgi:hypothetical protein
MWTDMIENAASILAMLSESEVQIRFGLQLRTQIWIMGDEHGEMSIFQKWTWRNAWRGAW